MEIRNIAIIAHVDHGKTTLTDALMRQTGAMQEGASMDSNALEQERGITIYSKNAAIAYRGTKINIVDTPGHADFGSEVERVLRSIDSVLLVVDAQEGPMPQTRFVLKKALETKHKIVVVMNKIDKRDADINKAHHKTLDLFLELGADDETADFPVVYASAKSGLAGFEPNLNSMRDISPIFEAIIKHIPPPSGDSAKPLQMLVSSITSDAFRGRIAIGRVVNGQLKTGQEVMHINRAGEQKKYKLTSIMTFEGLNRVEVPEVLAGDIAAVAGVGDIFIGETIADAENPQALPLLDIEESTVKMTFKINDSPFAGKEGKFCTSRQIRERLYKELETDMALKIEDSGMNAWTVSGRGELHLAILIERLRREGYELQVSRPQVINKTIEGKEMTPYETVAISVPDEFAGIVIQKLGGRQGVLQNMHSHNGSTSLEFILPTRGLFGYRSEFLTDTKGLGIINAVFYKYQPDPGNWKEREQGSLVAHESGVSNLYGLLNVQDRGTLFIGPAVAVYKGQVVGQNARPEDIHVNVCKTKQLSNMRSKGEGSAEHFKAPHIMGLEDALEYIGDDELVEVTPQNIRIRKMVLDKAQERRKSMGQG
ncbi:MAG: translational GTPase TypA [Candidatus Doudnabacteria bacterium]|nr:translational GTPase TypA [Candidatus Doudnabacteria bacterium]